MDDKNTVRTSLTKGATAIDQTRVGNISGGFSANFGQFADRRMESRNDGFFESIGKTALSGIKALPSLPWNITKTIAGDIKSSVELTADSISQFFTDELKNNVRTSKATLDSLEKADAVMRERYRKGEISKSQWIEYLNDYTATLQGISQGLDVPTVGDRAVAIADTFLLPFAFGRFQTAKNVVKGGKAFGLTKNHIKAAENMEDALKKIPSFGHMLKTNAARSGALPVWEAAKNGSKHALTGFYIKYPLYVGQNVRDARIVLEDVINKEIGGKTAVAAAMLGFESFVGGPIGAAKHLWDKSSKYASVAMFDQNSLFDLVDRAVKWEGDKSIVGYMNSIQKSHPKLHKRWSKTLRQIQAMNLNAFDGDAHRAAAHFIHSFSQKGVDLSQMDAKWLLRDMENYVKSFDALHAAAKAGKMGKWAQKHADDLALGVMSRQARRTLIKDLKRVMKKGANNQQRKELAQKFLADQQAKGVQWTQNEKLYGFVRGLIDVNPSPKYWEARINKFKMADHITQWSDDIKIPKDLKKLINKHGYFPIMPIDIKARYVPIESAGKVVSRLAQDGVNFAAPRQARFGWLGRAINNVGLGVKDIGDYGHTMLRRSVANSLQEMSFKVDPKGSRVGAEGVIDTLQQYADGVRPNRAVQALVPGSRKFSPVYDIRLLKRTEIEDALGVEADVAKEIQQAIMRGYTDVPITVRGLGDKIQDWNLRGLPVSRGYARAQSTFRYSYNPFFRTQEVFETESLAQALTGGKRVQLPGVNWVRGLFGNSRKQIQDTVKLLDKKGLFTASYSGEAAADNVLSKITANITDSQRESIAGMALAMAKKKGVPLEKYLQQDIEEVGEAMRWIVQYPKKGPLNTALARTLNLAFFPTRYNMKVAMIAAEALGRQPIPVQLAVVKGLYNGQEWLESPEGIAWQQEHAEGIQVLKWLTPLGNLEWTYEFLTGRKDSWSDIGLVGGLPFGVIGQMLDSQLEDFNLSSPYVRPTDGAKIPEWIPESAKARAATALTDLLSSMFSYPGRILGLPGKGQKTRDFVNHVLGLDPSSDEFKRIFRDKDLTREQKLLLDAVMQAQEEYLGPGFDPMLPNPKLLMEIEEVDLGPEFEQVVEAYESRGSSRTKTSDIPAEQFGLDI